MYPLPGPAHAEAWPPEKRGSIGVFLQCFKSGNPAMATDAESLQGRGRDAHSLGGKGEERKWLVVSGQWLVRRGALAA